MPDWNSDHFAETFQIITELALIQIVERNLPELLGQDVKEYHVNSRLPGGGRPDLIVRGADDSITIFEVKNVTPSTRARLSSAVDQLDYYAEAFEGEHPDEKVQRGLVISGVLSPENIEFLRKHGIDRIIDGSALAAIVEGQQSQREAEPLAHEVLLARLQAISPGRKDWAEFQKLVGNILEYLFLPPLSKVHVEVSNSSKVNRRDFIMPNYVTDGFWAFLRNHYEAHYIVGDAKNLANPVSKSAVIQVANYLSSYGAGLFGLIVSRQSGDRACNITRREQWLYHRKMILVLDDTDLRQMIAMRAANDDPAELIRQEIEDFRLGI